MPGSVSNQKCDSEQSGQAHLKPIYLLADSQLLFESRAYGSRFLDDIVSNARVKTPSVAYIGASNGDNPSFYHEIFSPALESAGVGERRMIVSRPSAEDSL